jgi:hypothetical protein
MLLDIWKNNYSDVQGTIGNAKQACMMIWCADDELMEMFHMPLNKELDVVGPSETKEE